jgi:plasmid stabilization system protein ParE
VAEILFLPAADAEYRQAFTYYQERSARAAAGFEAAFEVALRAIGDVPARWTSCDVRHRFYTLRRYPYSIVYRVEPEEVLVVAVAHSSRAEYYWRGRG